MLKVNEVYSLRVCNIHICMYVGLVVYDLMYAQVYDRCMYMMYNVDVCIEYKYCMFICILVGWEDSSYIGSL